eukprot:scaffold45620_cov23-Tisochrysis_lutea.AAC.1
MNDVSVLVVRRYLKQRAGATHPLIPAALDRFVKGQHAGDEEALANLLEPQQLVQLLESLQMPLRPAGLQTVAVGLHARPLPFGLSCDCAGRAWARACWSHLRSQAQARQRIQNNKHVGASRINGSSPLEDPG